METKHEEKNPAKKQKMIRILFVVLYTVALSVFLVSCFHVVSYFFARTEQKSAKNQMLSEAIIPATAPALGFDFPSDAVETDTFEGTVDMPVIAKIPDISVDFTVLQEKYPGLVAWLYIPGDLLCDPVMQASDNDYFLYRLPNGKENSAGSLFLDYRDSATFSGWNHLIYGHNMKNKTMFGFLRNYRSTAFFHDHPYVFCFTPEGTYRIELFASMFTVADSFVYSRPQDKAEKDRYLYEAKRKSLVTSNVKVNSDDSIVVLSTCSGDVENNERFVVLGKVVPIL